MKEIEAKEIAKAVAQLCQQANFELGEDVLQSISEARNKEESPLAKDILDKLIENAEIAREERLPLRRLSPGGIRHKRYRYRRAG